MGFERRQQIIKELQEIRKTKIVTHINSDRRIAVGSPGLPAIQTKIGTEAQPFFYKVLQDLGKVSAIDLYLYTVGGQVDAVWPLVSLFREFGQQFNVLVPFKAHSGGTLICLGADTLVIGEAGELSPVDPTTANQFNPREANNRTPKAISVEDVTSYFLLAQNPGKINQDEKNTTRKESKVDVDLAFRILAEEIHPLALGNVNRSHTQIRELAQRLLELHYNKRTEKKQKAVKDIVNVLTQGRYSHTDILNRQETRNLLGESVVKFAEGDEHKLMWKLFEEYADALSLLKTFILHTEMEDNQQAEMTSVGGFIETEDRSFVFRTISQVSRWSQLPEGYQIQVQPGNLLPIIPGLPSQYHIELLETGWIENKEGR
jgi:hypothetical protein